MENNHSNSEANSSKNEDTPISIVIKEDSTKDVEEVEKKEELSPTVLKAMKKADFLGHAPLLSTIWKMTWPDLIAKVVQAMYSMIDSIFIGQFSAGTPEERRNALAGLAFASPVEMCILVGFSLVFAQGGGPLYGRYLGKRDEKNAGRVVGNTLMCDIILGIVMALILPFLCDPILILLGASETAKTLQPARQYILPLMYADILYNVCYATNNLMRGEGAALYSSALLIISACCNILGDFVFVKVLSVGIRGAAISTIIAYTIATSFGLWFFLSKRGAVEIKLKNFKPHCKLILKIMNTGLSGMVIGLANGIITIVSNRLVLAYSTAGPDAPETVAATAVSGSIAKMQYFCFLPINAIAHGVIAVLAFCRGGKLYDRFVKSIYVCFVGQLCVSLVLSVGCFIFANSIARLFNTDPLFVDIFTKALRYLCCCLWLSPFSASLYPPLQAVGRGFGSAFILFGRNCLYIVLSQFVLCFITKDYWGVFKAYPIAEVVSALVSIIYFFCVRKDFQGKTHLVDE